VNSKDIIDAFTYVANEKGIDKVSLTAIIEDIFLTLISKKFGEENEDKFSVIVNMDRGEIEIFQEKIVVDKVKDADNEIILSDALKIDKTLTIGEICIDILDPGTFGRRLINTAKHHLLNKIKDVEKKSVYDEFVNKVHDIYSGYVHQIQRNRIFITDENKNELILPRSGQIPNDRYKRGQQIRGLIDSVEYSTKGLEIILSRTSNIFLKRLFELEVPEIDDGIIEIKAISREPGERSKVVVFSSDRRIDAVGACVGMKGNRIQSIVRELNGEKIDIINWSDKPEILISRALAPANPINLLIDEEKPYAVAIFEDDDLAIAIGSNGQNIKLASDVTEYTIDVIKKSDYESNQEVDLSSIDGLSDKIISLLADNNIKTSKDFLTSDQEVLLGIKGFGEKTYEKVSQIIKESISS
jgi:N utilization substance protein A